MWNRSAYGRETGNVCVCVACVCVCVCVCVCGVCVCVCMSVCECGVCVCMQCTEGQSYGTLHLATCIDPFRYSDISVKAVHHETWRTCIN